MREPRRDAGTGSLWGHIAGTRPPGSQRSQGASAFGAVFGRGCSLPAIQWVEEFAEDVVMSMNFDRAEIHEPSFGLLLRSVKGTFKSRKRSSQ